MGATMTNSSPYGAHSTFVPEINTDQPPESKMDAQITVNVPPKAGRYHEGEVVGLQDEAVVVHGQDVVGVSGGETYPILPFPGEISYRYFKGCQKYF